MTCSACTGNWWTPRPSPIHNKTSNNGSTSCSTTPIFGSAWSDALEITMLVRGTTLTLWHSSTERSSRSYMMQGDFMVNHRKQNLEPPYKSMLVCNVNANSPAKEDVVLIFSKSMARWIQSDNSLPKRTVERAWKSTTPSRNSKRIWSLLPDVGIRCKAGDSGGHLHLAQAPPSRASSMPCMMDFFRLFKHKVPWLKRASWAQTWTMTWTLSKSSTWTFWSSIRWRRVRKQFETLPSAMLFLGQPSRQAFLNFWKCSVMRMRKCLEFLVGEVRRLLQALQEPSAWTFLCQSSTTHHSVWHRPIAQLEQFCVAELERPMEEPRPLVPRPFGRERYILHLFAGRRRRGDFQFYVDSLQHLHGGMQIYVLSVDIVIDDKWSDLANEETRQFWIRAIFDRHIVALIGGPPCETWSRARGKPFKSLAANRRQGPRVIRTLQEIWGMSSLSLRELAQIKIGNLLMGFQLIAMAALSCTGGVAVLEHPATPPEEEAASIWRTPIMQLLLQLPDFTQITLAQGLWGAHAIRKTHDLCDSQCAGLLQGAPWGHDHQGPPQRHVHWPWWGGPLGHRQIKRVPARALLGSGKRYSPGY